MMIMIVCIIPGSRSPGSSGHDTRAQASMPRLPAAHERARPLHLMRSSTPTSTPTNTSTSRADRHGRHHMCTMRPSHRGGGPVGHRLPAQRRLVASTPIMQPRRRRTNRVTKLSEFSEMRRDVSTLAVELSVSPGMRCCIGGPRWAGVLVLEGRQAPHHRGLSFLRAAPGTRIASSACFARRFR
jgi:hypothetical protein